MTEDEKLLEKEQEVLANINNDIAAYLTRIQSLKTQASSSASSDTAAKQWLSTQKLTHLERNLKLTQGKLDDLSPGHDDLALIEQHGVQLADYRKQLSSIHDELSHFWPR